eukprot:1157821-Pelagomonas_calceolata.AAC.6
MLYNRYMRDVVRQCLQKDPEQRPTAAQLLHHKFFKQQGKDNAYLIKALKIDRSGEASKIGGKGKKRGKRVLPVFLNTCSRCVDSEYETQFLIAGGCKLPVLMFWVRSPCKLSLICTLCKAS